MWENDCLSYPRDSDMVVTENWHLYGLTALLWDTEGFLGYGLFFPVDGFLKIILHIHAGADSEGFTIPISFFSM